MQAHSKIVSLQLLSLRHTTHPVRLSKTEHCPLWATKGRRKRKVPEVTQNAHTWQTVSPNLQSCGFADNRWVRESEDKQKANDTHCERT
jgi:hypothetical protein